MRRHVAAESLFPQRPHSPSRSAAQDPVSHGLGRSPGVPATQSVAVVQVFLALSCEPAIRTKQIITGALKLIFSSDGAQPPTDVRQCTNYKT